MALLVWAAPLAAQVPFEGCVDRWNKPVRGIVRGDLVWGGTATRVNGESVIYWNARNNQASRTSQIFLYLHECAHHALGHLNKSRGARWELEADCWAVQLMWESGMIQGRHLRLLEQETSRSWGDDIHLSGAERTRSLTTCLELKTDREAWAAALDTMLQASEAGFVAIEGQSVPLPGQNSGVFETEVDLPGTYDCEIRQEREVRCVVFAARTHGRVSNRFDELSELIEHWLPDGWTASEISPADTGIVRQFVAQDSGAGQHFHLVATSNDRIVFTMFPSRAFADRQMPELLDDAPMALASSSDPRQGPAPSDAAGERVSYPDPTTPLVLHQGVAVRVRVPRFGTGWIRARVARTASDTPCMLFQLERTDAAGRTQYAFVKAVSAIEVDRRMWEGVVVNLDPAEEGDWYPAPLDVVRRQDASCRR
ncbi:MAG TPA: hypothetical protein VFS94_04170 [Gemmatimonadales bacterium]|nr:hypothetical protein [Gemmatimonadales bacterium]